MSVPVSAVGSTNGRTAIEGRRRWKLSIARIDFGRLPVDGHVLVQHADGRKHERLGHAVALERLHHDIGKLYRAPRSIGFGFGGAHQERIPQHRIVGSKVEADEDFLIS